MDSGQQVLTLWFAEAETCWLTWRWAGGKDAHAAHLHPSLRDALTAVYAQALPNVLPHESVQQALDRALAGPLGSPDASLELGSQLADVLIPWELSHDIIRRSQQGQQRIIIKIHVSPSLAQVPWSLLHIRQDPAGTTRRLLIDFADLSIGIPRNAAQQAKRWDSTAARLRVPGDRRDVVAVIDPKVPGFSPASELGSILGRPEDDDELAVVLKRHAGHLVPAVATYSDLVRRTDTDRVWLCEVLPQASALLYVGHVSVAQQHLRTGASSAMHLCCVDDEGRHRPLSAADIVNMDSLVFPEKVAIVGCGSGSDHMFPEPMGLSLAAHLRGAHCVIAASWTLPTDAYMPHAPLRRLILVVDEALTSSDPVRAINAWQRERAVAWFRDGRPEDGPLLWAAMQVFVR